jgi:hypothetical protein
VVRQLSAQRGRLLLVLTLAALSLSLTIGSAPASAGLGVACPAPTAQVFRPWADYAYYAALVDGGFEGRASGWTLAGGAKVVAGNEPFYLNSKNDRYSLLLPAGSSATSPPMCISLLSSKMRFVIGGPNGSTVNVQVLYRGLLSSVLGVFDGGPAKSNGKWAPSPEIGMLGGTLPLLTQSVQFRFVSTAGTPQIDDAYLDPWKIG